MFLRFFIVQGGQDVIFDVATKLPSISKGSREKASMIVGVSNSIDTNLILIDICIVLTCLRIFLLANVAAISSLLISF